AIPKDVDDAFDGSFFNRLSSIVDVPPRLPNAEPVSFLPLCLRTVSNMFDERTAPHHTSRTLITASKRGMPNEPPFDTDEFLSRTANAADRLLEDMASGTVGRFNCDAGFITDSLRENASPGGRLTNWY
ncbi:MAG: hypothetical protein KDA84_21570, partial [Planctomycetaceae bacterium]|nr:hypothetical protein [Planctomycetaceae bacterium]